ncbi:uncharacterized protein CLUP02_05727 [Colletotrichum lupini]|uniref:Uncharacterized protein n=1 Tax=Colletotrichum lupini TaxID=145971 RepID=A0A9Q8SNP4_9PEZI|nr:uncharacterized protein CLUP02_05727 [Colletotrichum lupini]UQC80245.1 hypothetical protein CLUP02_05727 [Colletotrichum lupini]
MDKGMGSFEGCSIDCDTVNSNISIANAHFPVIEIEQNATKSERDWTAAIRSGWDGVLVGIWKCAAPSKKRKRKKEHPEKLVGGSFPAQRVPRQDTSCEVGGTSRPLAVQPPAAFHKVTAVLATGEPKLWLSIPSFLHSPCLPHVMSTKKKQQQQLAGELSTIEPAFHVRLLNIGRRAGIGIPSTVTTLQMDVKILSDSHGPRTICLFKASTSTSLEEFPATSCPVQYNTTLWLSGCIGPALILQCLQATARFGSNQSTWFPKLSLATILSCQRCGGAPPNIEWATGGMNLHSVMESESKVDFPSSRGRKWYSRLKIKAPTVILTMFDLGTIRPKFPR